MRRFGLIALLVVLVTAVAAYFGFQSAQTAVPELPTKPITVPVTEGEVVRSVTAPGQLVGTQEMILGVDVNGRLLSLNVLPGSVVEAGDIIATLDPGPYENALRMAQIALDQAQADFEQRIAEAGLAIEAAEAQVQSTQAQTPSLTIADLNLQSAREHEARAAYEYQKAQDRHWEPQEVVESYRLEWVAAQRGVTAAEAEYNRILNQQWAVIQQANALSKNVEQSTLNAQFLTESGVNPLLIEAVKQAEADLNKTIIKAPFDGIVVEVFARPGEQLPAGANLVLITNPAAGEVRTTVIEEDLSQVTIGLMAEVYFDARPDIEVQGMVARIVPQRVAGEARPLYHVFITLLDPVPENVFAGMTADASILIEGIETTVRLPRALVAARSDNTATVKVWQNGRSQTQEITVGLRGDVYIEILEGLAVGDEVVGE